MYTRTNTNISVCACLCERAREVLTFPFRDFCCLSFTAVVECACCVGCRCWRVAVDLMRRPGRVLVLSATPHRPLLTIYRNAARRRRHGARGTVLLLLSLSSFFFHRNSMFFFLSRLFESVTVPVPYYHYYYYYYSEYCVKTNKQTDKKTEKLVFLLLVFGCLRQCWALAGRGSF
jgi:hypothetical protein